MLDPESLTDDAFLGGQLQMLQPRKAYRAGIDAVLLAAAVPARLGHSERVLDAGAGVGVVGLSVARRVEDARVTLVEIEPSLALIARSNINRNGLGDRVRVVAEDVARGGAAFGSAGGDQLLQVSGFDHVAANPPFHVSGHGSSSPDNRKARAHEMPLPSLDGWMRFLATACVSGGTVTIIHLASALPDLIAVMAPRFGDLQLMPVHPREGQPANRVIVQGTKGSKAPLLLLPGLVLHETDGNGYRSQIDAILRHGAPLAIGSAGR